MSDELLSRVYDLEDKVNSRLNDLEVQVRELRDASTGHNERIEAVERRPIVWSNERAQVAESESEWLSAEIKRLKVQLAEAESSDRESLTLYRAARNRLEAEVERLTIDVERERVISGGLREDLRGVQGHLAKAQNEIERLTRERDEATADCEEFMRNVGAIVLGPPDEDVEWGGGAIIDGLRKLRRDIFDLTNKESRARAEVERLKAELHDFEADTACEDRCEQLEAEVERLREANSALSGAAIAGVREATAHLARVAQLEAALRKIADHGGTPKLYAADIPAFARAALDKDKP